MYRIRNPTKVCFINTNPIIACEYSILGRTCSQECIGMDIQRVSIHQFYCNRILGYNRRILVFKYFSILSTNDIIANGISDLYVSSCCCILNMIIEINAIPFDVSQIVVNSCSVLEIPFFEIGVKKTSMTKHIIVLSVDCCCPIKISMTNVSVIIHSLRKNSERGVCDNDVGDELIFFIVNNISARLTANHCFFTCDFACGLVICFLFLSIKKKRICSQDGLIVFEFYFAFGNGEFCCSTILNIFTV